VGLIDLIILKIKAYYILFLIILIYFGTRAVYSYFTKEVEVLDINSYRKGPTKYKEPPRPHSPKFNEFVNLATLTGTTKQWELVKILSQSLQDHVSKVSYKHLFNKDICDLIEDPNKWLVSFYSEIESSKIYNSEYTSKRLFDRIMKILDEVSNKLTIKIEIPDEWKES